MKVLLALTYYRPHLSGLTIYVERLGQELARRGHQVTVLTSQFEKHLPLDEMIEGVRVRRIPVALRVSKGVIMPTMGYWATKMAREHDVMSVHLPQLDAAGIAARGRIFNTPTVLTYHCDLQLPPGMFNRVVDQVVFGANYTAAKLADRIVAYTQDYADHSRLLSRFKRKITVIPPPVIMPSPSAEEVKAFREKHGLVEGQPVVGFAARFAAEKGIEYMVEGMPQLLQRFPDLKVLFAGPYKNVLGEEQYWASLAPQIERLGQHWKFLGTLTPKELPAFYSALDCLAVTSVNSTESFGLVQVEAMLCGTPVVSTSLPGVRQPVRMTGMGEVVPIADTIGLVEGVTRVLENKQKYLRPREEIEAKFDLDRTVSAYEALFESELRAKGRRAR